MKQILISFILFIVFPGHSWSSDIHFEFQNMGSTKGTILFLLFKDEEGFPDQEDLAIRQGSVEAFRAKEMGISVKDLPDGTYALSVFHDENGNGKLDTNYIGIPKEAFAFSMNPKVFFGPPSFKKARFKLSNSLNLKIEFIHF